MRPVRGPFIRPLLTFSRTEIREWAAARGHAWREDQSNFESKFTRNRLRMQTLPELANAYNANLENVLAGTARVAQAEEDYWDELVRTSFRNLASLSRWGITADASAILALPLALRRRLIRHILRELRGDLSGLDLFHIDEVLRVCDSQHGHDRVMLPGADIVRSFDTVLFALPGRLSEARQYRIAIEPGLLCNLPYGEGLLRVDNVTDRSQYCANFRDEQYFLRLDPFLIHATHPLEVRNWRPGDELMRPGHQKPEKLKTLFQEQKVLLWERKHWPVLVWGEEIVWTRQFGCASSFEAPPDLSGPLLRLIYFDSVSAG
jgi:tRNA(Ile)-lysidine synthase